MTSPADVLAGRVIAGLSAAGLTLATSESLTGGLIGAALTSVPGASRVYLGGVIAYATALKTRLSGVDAGVLERHGAVSAETVGEMAQGIRGATGADWAIAASGVAGPSQQEGHPPGTVWIAVAGPRIGRARRFDFAGDRSEVRAQTVAAALTMVLAELDRR